MLKWDDVRHSVPKLTFGLLGWVLAGCFGFFLWMALELLGSALLACWE